VRRPPVPPRGLEAPPLCRRRTHQRMRSRTWSPPATLTSNDRVE